MSLDIYLTNNLGNKKEKFIPKDKNNVRMYVCGPTVYDDPHIGNARPVVVFDILFKILKNKYPNVTYVRNITDVDDKIIKSSKENNISISELTKKITKSFNKDCIYIYFVKNQIHEPKATENISEMIEMICELIKKGFAYENNNHVYFEVKKFKDYGQLSNKNLDELVAGSRIEVSENKKIQKILFYGNHQKQTSLHGTSPWGGRPGWHLECSAMSKKYLENEFDVHGGGIDLIFPHHENEIAQSRCANDTKVFANYWLHNAFITMSNEKMAKSQGNILKIKDFRKKMSGQVLRLALMSAHYRQPLRLD